MNFNKWLPWSFRELVVRNYNAQMYEIHNISKFQSEGKAEEC